MLKKSALIPVPVLIFSFFTAARSKSDIDPALYYTPEGKWIGNAHNHIVRPVSCFAVILQTSSVMTVEANGAATPDIVTGSSGAWWV